MDVLLTVLHVMACVILIAVVLLQHGKGADMGAMLGGGGANTVFGSRGAGNFLTKVTTACAVVFMVTSLSLSYLMNLGSDDLIFDGEVLDEPAPAEALEEIPEAAADEGDAGALEEIPIQPAPDSDPVAPAP
ncbi:MAG: preprotein translocase subunit SecG [Myxococcota bacterium]